MRMFENRYGEMRSGYKIALVFLTLIICQIALLICKHIVAGESIIISSMGEFVDTVFNLMSELIFIFIPMLFWRLGENKSIDKMGLINIKKGYKDFAVGLALGAVSISICAIVLICFNKVEIKYTATGIETVKTLLLSLILYISVGFAEEILCRGYIMSILKRTRNKYSVIIISALIFAAMHLGNYGISLLAFINLALMGAVFGYIFMKTKNIWMCIGYHITWNYFQGAVWGFSVSGTGEKGICSLANLGDNIINGGAFGPEGGIVVTIILCLVFVGIYIHYKDKDINEFMNID